jgi:hypothetical protein
MAHVRNQEKHIYGVADGRRGVPIRSTSTEYGHTLLRTLLATGSPATFHSPPTLEAVDPPQFTEYFQLINFHYSVPSRKNGTTISTSRLLLQLTPAQLMPSRTSVAKQCWQPQPFR